MDAPMQTASLQALGSTGERAEWRLALQFLALDRVLPLWRELGLEFQAPGMVLEAFRRFVRAERRIAYDDDDPAYAKKMRQLTEKLLAELSEIGGPEAARSLCMWFETSYAGEPKWHWMWRILLFHLTPDEGEELARRGMPAEKAKEIVQLGERWRASVDSIEMAITRAKTGPLSPWDRTEYRRSKAEYEEYDPVDGLLEALERPRFDRLWSRAIALLTPREVDLLIAWGREYAQGLDLGSGPLAARLSPTDAEIPKGWRIRN
ncbi:MAG: hypothetical protein ACYCWW_10845 [Deltaproteobacteria bacterium]